MDDLKCMRCNASVTTLIDKMCISCQRVVQLAMKMPINDEPMMHRCCDCGWNQEPDSKYCECVAPCPISCEPHSQQVHNQHHHCCACWEPREDNQ